jgi:hypothetical protein
MATTTSITKDNNQTNNRILLETVHGVLNSPAGTFEDLRVLSNTLVENSETVKSEEIRSDRNVQEHVKVGESVSGDVGFELSYGSYDTLFEGLLNEDWAAAIAETSTTLAITGSMGGGDLKITDSAVGITPGDFPAGKFIRVTGFTGANATTVRHYAMVSGVATTAEIPIQSATLVAEAAGDSITLKSSGMLRNGVKYKSYTVEKEEIDTGDFYHWLGCIVASAQLEISPQAILQGSFSFLGASEIQGAATVGDGAPTSVTASKIINTTSNVAHVLVDGGDGAFDFTDFSISIDNEGRQDVAAAKLSPLQSSIGDFNASASLEIFNKGGEALYDKYEAQTTHRFSIVVEDSDNNAYVFTIHSAKLNSATNPLSGKNATRLLSLELAGQYDSLSGCTFQIDRILS